MSAISSRPRISEIAAPVFAALVAGGGAVAVLSVRGLAKCLSRAGREAFDKESPKLLERTQALLSPSVLQKKFRIHQLATMKHLEKHSLPPAEALRVSTLLSLASTPCYQQELSLLKKSWKDMGQARSMAEVQNAQQTFFASLHEEHSKVFARALSTACKRAAAKIGFDRIDTVSSQAGFTRLIATNPAGHALVSEIRVGSDREPMLATEVVGVSDGSCEATLDAFDRAIEAEGIRASAPDRKFTGGVCELAAARRFVRHIVRRTAAVKQKQPHAAKKDEATRRARRLNESSTTKIRHGR